MISLTERGKDTLEKDAIIIRNRFYRYGISENEVHSYYIRHKQDILKETEGREVMLFLQTENNLVVRRNDKDGQPAKLTAKNYSDLIHRRIISIHSVMRKTESFGIVDVDIDNFATARTATNIVYKYLSNISTFKSIKIRYTGKQSFHIVCDFGKNIPIDNIRMFLRKLLENEFEGKYDIAAKRTAGKVNLDLSSNKYRGGFITLGSLSVWGLKCVEIPIGSLSRFTPIQVKIK